MSFIAQHWQRAMVDAQALSQVFSVESGVWSIVAVVSVLAFRIWRVFPEVMARLNERRRDRNSAEDRHQARLEARIEKLEKRCDDLEEALAETRCERDEWKSRAVAAEAFLSGEGQARQVGQMIASTEREADAAARKGKA